MSAHDNTQYICRPPADDGLLFLILLLILLLRIEILFDVSVATVVYLLGTRRTRASGYYELPGRQPGNRPRSIRNFSVLPRGGVSAITSKWGIMRNTGCKLTHAH